MKTPQERFWAKVDKTDGCWLWTAGKDIHGYGKFSMGGKTYGAHRFAYIAEHGEPALGLVLDHLCRTRSCVRPSHLEPVTDRVNLMRGETLAATNAAKTHCKRGHEFNVENTEPVPGGRGCRECRRAAWRRWNAKRMSIVRGV